MTFARNSAVGAYGEDVAARHLRTAGLIILERNWSCRHGEIDIVARDGDTLVVCEVKTRTSLRHGSPAEAVIGAKAIRLRRLAAAWLEERALTPRTVRIDVVSIVVPAKGPATVTHLTGVA